MKCKKHPKYMALREPRTDCDECWLLWLNKDRFPELGSKTYCELQLPIRCTCGVVLTETNLNQKDCERDEDGDSCEICDYCGPEKCPKCGDHLHCGGCV